MTILEAESLSNTTSAQTAFPLQLSRQTVPGLCPHTPGDGAGGGEPFCSGSGRKSTSSTVLTDPRAPQGPAGFPETVPR